MAKPKPIYYNEIDQKIWRTTATIDDVDFVYVGNLSKTEYELLLELLFDIFGTEDISKQDVQKLHDDFRFFLDVVKGLN